MAVRSDGTCVLRVEVSAPPYGGVRWDAALHGRVVVGRAIVAVKMASGFSDSQSL